MAEPIPYTTEWLALQEGQGLGGKLMPFTAPAATTDILTPAQIFQKYPDASSPEHIQAMSRYTGTDAIGNYDTIAAQSENLGVTDLLGDSTVKDAFGNKTATPGMTGVEMGQLGLGAGQLALSGLGFLENKKTAGIQRDVLKGQKAHNDFVLAQAKAKQDAINKSSLGVG